MDDGIARMGEVALSSSRLPEIRALGLGSCIGLCLFDPVSKLACIAHIMLPTARTQAGGQPGKYADTAIPYAVDQMISRGAVRSRIRSAMVGGAQLFTFEGVSDSMDVGKRNTEAVKRILADAGIKLVAEDTGGKCGRTVTLNSATGEVVVKQAGANEKCLANLMS